MNDITALMATMKAAAEKAIGAHERLSVMPSDGLFDASLAENAQLESDITALIAHNDESTPANVKALVEALEKAQRHANLTEAERQAYLGLIAERDERISELESRTVKLPEVEKWRKPDAVRAQNAYRILAANELTAAGIQVIEGEGQ